MSTTVGRFIVAHMGLDGPVVPILDPAEYAWPEGEDEATADRMAAHMISIAVQNDASREPGTTQTAILADALGCALAQLAQLDRPSADEFAREIWHNVEFGATGRITWAARAMGIPTGGTS